MVVFTRGPWVEVLKSSGEVWTLAIVGGLTEKTLRILEEAETIEEAVNNLKNAGMSAQAK